MPSAARLRQRLDALAYNVLRLISRNVLSSDDAPPRHPAKRRRLRTVIQELMGVAGAIVHHAQSCCDAAYRLVTESVRN